MATAKAKTSSPKKPGQQPQPAAAKKPPAFRIETVGQQQKTEKYLKLLIYGNYGVGKTTLAASAADVAQMKDVIFLDAESGNLSIDPELDVDVIKLTNFRMMGQIHEFLRQHCVARDAKDIDKLRTMESTLRACDPADVETPRQYHTVVLDSLTEIEAYCMTQLLGISDTTRLDEEIDGAEWAEYKKNNAMMLRIVRAFRDLPMNVIFVCSQKFIQDETKKQKFTPAMTGQLTSKVQGFMDMVGYLQVGATEGGTSMRRLSVSPSASGRYDAKHRYQAFHGDHFDNPSIGAILKEVGLVDGEVATK